MTAPFPQMVTFIYADPAEPCWRFYGEALALPLVLDQSGCRIYRVAGDHDIVIETNFKRVVCGISVVALEENVRRGSFRLHKINDREEGDALEFDVVTAPGRHAMEVAHVRELRKRQELFPFKCDRFLDLAMDS